MVTDKMVEKLTYRKAGLILFAIALIIIASVVVYTAYVNNKPENKELGEILIHWYVAEYNELLEDSDLIVVATVTNKTGIWGTTDGKKPSRFGGNKDEIFEGGILTEYTFRPVDVLKGNTTTIIGRIRGGEVDGYSQKASPTPSFEVGDTVLLFLKNNTDADGNPMFWYYVGWPTSFIEENGKFVNDCYDDILIDALKKDIEDGEAV